MPPQIETHADPTVFLISPAKLGGRRGVMLLNEAADFELARELRSPEGAPLASVFSFVSGLYFRGKVTYARQFGRALGGLPAAHVLTAGGGLCLLDERVTVDRLRRWATVKIHENNPHFTAPLSRHASELLDLHGSATRFVLLGSVATGKYTGPLLDVFGDRLFVPKDFVGLGDMARGSLLLRAVREKNELAYATILSCSRSLRS